MGCAGLSYDDFCRLTVPEFEAVYKAYSEREEALFRDSWNRTRVHAAISIQPHLGKRHRITPQKLLPMPWDKEERRKRRKSGEPEMTPEQREERMRRVLEKFRNK